METTEPDSDSFNESQSIQLIREMIQFSQKRLQNDGILMLVWGWTMVYVNLANVILGGVALTFQLHRLITILGFAVGLFAVGFSVYYIVSRRKKVQTYIGISLRYIWISMFFCMVLISQIQFNVLHQIHFELQYPIFMVIISFAVVATGAILRYKMITFGGIAFGLLALLSSYLPLIGQQLIGAVAWIIAFVIPGHILYAKHKKQTSCSAS